MDLWSLSCLCGWLVGQPADVRLSSCLVLQKLSCWTLYLNFSAKLFLTCHTCRNHLSLALVLACDHEVSGKPDLLSNFFRTLFIWLGWDCGVQLQAVQVEYPVLVLREVYWIGRNTGCFADSENFYAGMHLGVCGPIWFKFGVMISGTWL